MKTRRKHILGKKVPKGTKIDLDLTPREKPKIKLVRPVTKAAREPSHRKQRSDTGKAHQHKSPYKKLKLLGTERPCMCCLNPFLSEGIHNRLCISCRNKSAD